MPLAFSSTMALSSAKEVVCGEFPVVEKERVVVVSGARGGGCHQGDLARVAGVGRGWEDKWAGGVPPFPMGGGRASRLIYTSSDVGRWKINAERVDQSTQEGISYCWCGSGMAINYQPPPH